MNTLGEALKSQNKILANLSDEQLVELAEVVNSDYPGQNELARTVCEQIFQQITLTCFIGLGCLVAYELSIRFRLALAFS